MAGYPTNFHRIFPYFCTCLSNVFEIDINGSYIYTKFIPPLVWSAVVDCHLFMCQYRKPERRAIRRDASQVRKQYAAPEPG